MNKHFNIDDANHESDWKDLTIMRLLSDVADLEDRIDKAIDYLKSDNYWVSQVKANDYLLDILKGSDEE